MDGLSPCQHVFYTTSEGQRCVYCGEAPDIMTYAKELANVSAEELTADTARKLALLTTAFVDSWKPSGACWRRLMGEIDKAARAGDFSVTVNAYNYTQRAVPAFVIDNLIRLGFKVRLQDVAWGESREVYISWPMK